MKMDKIIEAVAKLRVGLLLIIFGAGLLLLGTTNPPKIDPIPSAQPYLRGLAFLIFSIGLFFENARSNIFTLKTSRFIVGLGIITGIVASLLPITQIPTVDVQPCPTIIAGQSTPTSMCPGLEAQLTDIVKTPTENPIATDTPEPPPPPPKGMIEIQGGSYLIGSDVLGTGAKPYPQHQVILDTFWIHRYEVTNKLYKTCVEDDVCTPPDRTTSPTRSAYYLNPIYYEYPVIYVSYDQAVIYCEWIGGTIPTEEQWEASARGVYGYTYPWGNDAPSQGDASLGINGVLTDNQKVGFYPKDKTPTGIYDMAGNVSEWTSSWLVSYPGSLVTFNHTDEFKTIKGGNYRTTPNLNYTRNYYRHGEEPTAQEHVIGFRCVWTPP